MLLLTVDDTRRAELERSAGAGVISMVVPRRTAAKWVAPDPHPHLVLYGVNRQRLSNSLSKVARSPILPCRP